jgi:hypothetical protein
VTDRSFNGAYPSTPNTDWKNETDLEMGKFARDEPTLATMPFIRLNSGNREGPVKFEWTTTGRDGKTHDFYQIFRSGKNEILPGPTAGRVIMALFSISPGEIDKNLQVQANLSNLAKLCRLKEAGSNNAQLRKAICRLKGVTIETNAFWDTRNQQYMEESKMSIFSNYHIGMNPQGQFVRVQWDSAVTSLMNTWSRPLNLNHLFRLDSCLARKLYQVSSLGIYQQGEMVEDLKLLCHGQLGISQDRRYPSELKRSLKKPIEALQEKNLIDITIEEDTESPSIKSDWLVRARPMEGMLEVYDEIEDPQYWACHLANRGMLDFKENPLEECRKWVDNKGVPRIQAIVKEYDRRRSDESEDNPVRHAGWIYDMLRHEPDLQEENDSIDQEEDEHVMIY